MVITWIKCLCGKLHVAAGLDHRTLPCNALVLLTGEAL
jgi:hypothetical protein